jgi:hypothetical protein
MTENCKLCRAILSAFYNILQRNFGILLTLWCSFKLWWNFCLDLLSSKFWLIGDWSIATRTKLQLLYMLRSILASIFTSSWSFATVSTTLSIRWFISTKDTSSSPGPSSGGIHMLCYAFKLFLRQYFITTYNHMRRQFALIQQDDHDFCACIEPVAKSRWLYLAEDFVWRWNSSSQGSHGQTQRWYSLNF